VPSVLDAAVTNLGAALQSTASQVSHHGASTLANTQDWLNQVNSCVIMLPRPPPFACGQCSLTLPRHTGRMCREVYIISSTRADRSYKHPRCQVFESILGIPSSNLIQNAPAHHIQCNVPALETKVSTAAIYQTTMFDDSANTLAFFLVRGMDSSSATNPTHHDARCARRLLPSPTLWIVH